MASKFLGAICITLFLPGMMVAQRVDYNAIILPESAKDISFEEKLVRLAWNNNPSNQLLANQVNVAQYDVKLAKRFWLSQIGATGNINEFTVNPPPVNQSYPFYPRYNFSATVSLGNFFSDPLKSKRAKEQVQIAVQTVNSQKITIRAEVLRRYQTYKTNNDLLLIQKEITDEAERIYKQATDNFAKASISFEQYRLVVENYNAQKSKFIVAESNVKLAIIDIEEMIGVKFSDVR